MQLVGKLKLTLIGLRGIQHLTIGAEVPEGRGLYDDTALYDGRGLRDGEGLYEGMSLLEIRDLTEELRGQAADDYDPWKGL